MKSELNQFISLKKDDIDDIIGFAIKSNSKNIYQEQNGINRIEKRIGDIDNIILKLYNDYALGKISDEQLSSMLAKLNTIRLLCRAEKNDRQKNNRML